MHKYAPIYADTRRRTKPQKRTRRHCENTLAPNPRNSRAKPQKRTRRHCENARCISAYIGAYLRISAYIYAAQLYLRISVHICAHRRITAYIGAYRCISAHICTYWRISAYIVPYLRISAHIGAYLRISEESRNVPVTPGPAECADAFQ